MGFTESGGNFQVNNYDKGGQPGDSVIGLVQAGAASGGAPTYTGRDNAYFLPLPDGVPSWSGMFLWEPINDAFEGPCRDGDFDAGVIEHEYAHGLSNRYVGTEDLSLDAHQSGSMGEGWGDWYALNYLAREGYANDSVLGAYVTGNKSAASATGPTTTTRRPSATSATTWSDPRCTPMVRSGPRHCGSSARRWSQVRPGNGVGDLGAHHHRCDAAQPQQPVDARRAHGDHDCARQPLPRTR